MPPALRQTAARRAAALEIKSALPAGDGRHCAPPRRSATTAFAQSSTSFRHPAGPAGEICERAKASVSPNSTDGCCAAGAGPSGPASTPAKRRRAGAGAPEAKPPENWEEVYRKIKDFRGDPANSAPVDVMGCERLGDLCAEPKVFRWQTLVALMLSSQTKDAVTSEAVSRLRAAAQQRGRPFDAQFVHDMDAGDLDRCIGKVGFHNRKTTYLKKAAATCLQSHNGDIPGTLDGLTALAGVGPKMAYLALQCAWGINEGVGVDTHVHRICNRLGWVDSKEPEETRRQLEAWLPPSRWREINPLFVGFGQVHCLPRFPRCDSCPVSDLCPSSTAKAGSRRTVGVVKVEYEEVLVLAGSGRGG